MRNLLLTLIIFTLGMQASECVGMRRIPARCDEDYVSGAIPIPCKRDRPNRRNEFKDVNPNKKNQSGHITGEVGSAQNKTKTSHWGEGDDLGDLNFDLEFN